MKRKAFTLVELIVVITILAILWTIAFISLSWYSKEARDSKRITDTSSLLSKINIEQTKWTPLSDLITIGEPVTLQILWENNPNVQSFREANFKTLKEDEKNFRDPSNKFQNYPLAYAIWWTWKDAYKFIQIATISEKENKAVIKWNYYRSENPNDAKSLFVIWEIELEDSADILPYIIWESWTWTCIATSIDWYNLNSKNHLNKETSTKAWKVLNNWIQTLEQNFACVDWIFKKYWEEKIINKCDEEYSWDEEIKDCNKFPKLNQACIWLPEWTEWNSVSSITQRWDWNDWSPSLIWTHNNLASTKDCFFKCINEPFWDWYKCVWQWSSDITWWYVFREESWNILYPKTCNELITNDKFKVISEIYNPEQNLNWFVDWIYYIKPNWEEAYKVYCEMQIDWWWWTLAFYWTSANKDRNLNYEDIIVRWKAIKSFTENKEEFPAITKWSINNYSQLLFKWWNAAWQWQKWKWSILNVYPEWTTSIWPSHNWVVNENWTVGLYVHTRWWWGVSFSVSWVFILWDDNWYSNICWWHNVCYWKNCPSFFYPTNSNCHYDSTSHRELYLR